MKEQRIFNSLLLLSGMAFVVLCILLLWRGIHESGPEPFGSLETSDPVLGGPYGPGVPDRRTANELHVLNKNLDKLLEVLQEIKGRIGE